MKEVPKKVLFFVVVEFLLLKRKRKRNQFEIFCYLLKKISSHERGTINKEEGRFGSLLLNSSSSSHFNSKKKIYFLFILILSKKRVHCTMKMFPLFCWLVGWFGTVYFFFSFWIKKNRKFSFEYQKHQI